jgi:S-adenosylmethionine:tRNA ribosyltransferase-isomerase
VKLSDFDYELPEVLIAQEPVSPRDASRLLVVPSGGGPFQDVRFRDLPDLLRPGDLLVFNDTRVIPARLLGTKASGGKCELLLIEPLQDPPLEGQSRWRGLGQSSKPLRPGSQLSFGPPGGSLAAEVETVEGGGFMTVRFACGEVELLARLPELGRIPLPPYIRREPSAEDRERYQTVLARVPGSVAAPTAGLHFTNELLARLAAEGVERTAVTLHVGPGTFLPIRTEDVDAHAMHEERYAISEATATAVADCRARRGRVVAVGTTAVRTLESAWRDGRLQPGEGRTSIFIRPGHAFGAVDALITNMHLPRSTLLMLVSAFGGHGRVLDAYRHAVAERYRFFSYGDAMFLG